MSGFQPGQDQPPVMQVAFGAGSAFQYVTIRPAKPLLDPGNANWGIASQWARGLLAEPQRVGEVVRFYPRSKEGGRPLGVTFEPVAPGELKSGPLKQQYDELQKQLAEPQPRDANERDVLATLRSQFEKLDPDSEEIGFSFFKYLAGKKDYRLVFCPGYRLSPDFDGMAPYLCGKCRKLNAVPPKTRGVCHACSTAAPLPRRRRAGALAMAALLLIAGAALGYHFWSSAEPPAPGPVVQGGESNDAPPGPIAPQPAGPHLTITPAEWRGPVGSQIQFSVARSEGAAAAGDSEAAAQDVLAGTVIRVDDRNIAAAHGAHGGFRARSPGQAVVTFHHGPLTAQATIVVEPPENPSSIEVQPAEFALRIGTTQRLTALGRFSDGREIDLTEAVEWTSDAPGVAYVFRGRVQGVQRGAAVVSAAYRASADQPAVVGNSKVQVAAEQNFRTLTLAVPSGELHAGQTIPLRAVVTTEDGQTFPVEDGSKMRLQVEPPDAAQFDNGLLHVRSPGPLKLTGNFGDLQAALPIEVLPPVEAPAAPSGSGDARLADSPPGGNPPGGDDIPPGGDHIVAGTPLRSGIDEPGPEPTPGARSPAPDPAAFQAIAIVPPSLAVRVFDEEPFRVVGVREDGGQTDIDPADLQWLQLPATSRAEVDLRRLRVRGVAPTGDEALVVAFGDHEARAQVQVVDAPTDLVLEPAGRHDLPAGLKLPLRPLVRLGGGRETPLSSDDVRWRFETNDRFAVRDGEVHALQPGGELELSFEYNDGRSNVVRIRSIEAPAEPVEVDLELQPATVALGQTGQVAVRSRSPEGFVPGQGHVFRSPTDGLAIDPQTGAFRAQAAGPAEVALERPDGTVAGRLNFEVQPRPEPRPAPDPRLVGTNDLRTPPGDNANGNRNDPPLDDPAPDIGPVSARLPADAEIASLQFEMPAGVMPLPAGALFRDFRVHAVLADGARRDVTREARLVAGDLPEGDPAAGPVVAIRDGAVEAINPGVREVTAEFRGVRSEPLRIEVAADVGLDRIELRPARLQLAINETRRLQAFGFRGDSEIGEITDRADLQWRSLSPETLEVGGGVVQALQAGVADVRVSLGEIVSNTVEVSASEAPSSGFLTIRPAALQMTVDESRSLGADVRVFSDRSDVSDFCQAASSRPQVVQFDATSRRLLAITPGQASLSFTHGGARGTLTVEVVRSSRPAESAQLLIEPADLALTVGQVQAVRVFEVSSSGERIDRTAAAELTIGDGAIAEIQRLGVAGLAPGSTSLAARLPGIAAPANASVQVAESEPEGLQVLPRRLTLSVGDRQRLAVRALAGGRQRTLGTHPELTFNVAGSDEASPPSFEVNSQGEVYGLAEGQGQVVVRWQGLEATVDVEVGDEPFDSLRIEPPQVRVRIGEQAQFTVTAARGGRLQPLNLDDGLEFQTSDDTIARPLQGLAVLAERTGRTDVIVRLGELRTTAQIIVEPGPTPPPPSPLRRLVMSPSRMRIRAGTDGIPFRVSLQTEGDEAPVDVTRQARIRVEDDLDAPADARPVPGRNADDPPPTETAAASNVEVRLDAGGALVVGRQPGQSLVHASFDGLETERPLVVVVFEASTSQAQLIVAPSRPTLHVGELLQLTQVHLVSAPGATPQSVPFRLTSDNEAILSSEGETLRAGAAGDVQIRVIANLPNDPFDGVSAIVPVRVMERSEPLAVERPAPGVEPDGHPDATVRVPPVETRLLLTGPTTTTVGAEVQLEAELLVGDRGRRVTREGTQYLLDFGPSELAAVGSDGVLSARRPGSVAVRARREGLISDPLVIRILEAPPAEETSRIELELSAREAPVGAATEYRLWAFDRQNRRRDITGSVRSPGSPGGDPAATPTPAGGEAAAPILHVIAGSAGRRDDDAAVPTESPTASAASVDLSARAIRGRAPGAVRVFATWGDNLRSNEESLQIVGAEEQPRFALEVEPEATVLAVGQSVPLPRVRGRMSDGRTFGLDNATVESRDPSVLRVDAGSPGRLAALQVGTTRLNVRHGSQTAEVRVRVTANPFAQVELVQQELPVDVLSENRAFQVRVKVQADADSEGWEYRVVLPDADQGAWKPLQSAGGKLQATLSSPELRATRSAIHHLHIEARSSPQGAVERFPLSFRLTGVQIGEVPSPDRRD